MVKVLAMIAFGMATGAQLSRLMVALLEEYDIFVHEDDDEELLC